MKIKFKQLLGPVLGLGMMGWLLSHIDFSRMGESWRQIKISYLLLSLLIWSVAYMMRALRWRFLLLAVQPIAIRKLISATMVGQAALWLLPFRMGEMGSPYALSQMERVKFSTLMGSVITDRLLDMFWLVGAIFFVVKAYALKTIIIPASLFGVEATISQSMLTHAARLLGGVIAGLLVFIVFLYFRPQRFVRLIHQLLDPLSRRLACRLEHLCFSFNSGLHVLRNKWHLAAAIGITLLYWWLIQWGICVLMAGFPLGIHPTMTHSLLVLVAVAAGLAMPNAPGYVGTLHLSVIVGLLFGAPGLDIHIATSFAIYYHLAIFIPCVMAGLIFMWLDKLSLIPQKTISSD